ncbi:hypothetical protein Pla123a_08980 [Posidoniimonas polymericola]|uniref:Uncharacterized protein n=1 Tax=Posidoniimonas polymericola TaxID=2528002 RepID=A0A5C5YT06_9BACT|nr:hypothetical protein Pla123a_08980 [Posidoniimonas polymericola]
MEGVACGYLAIHPYWRFVVETCHRVGSNGGGNAMQRGSEAVAAERFVRLRAVWVELNGQNPRRPRGDAGCKSL